MIRRHTAPKRARPPWRRLLLAFALGVGVLTSGGSLAAVADAPHSSPDGWDEPGVGTSVTLPLIATGYTSPRARLSRHGIGVDQAVGIEGFGMNALRVGWYWDWSTDQAPEEPGGSEYVQTVRFGQTGVTEYTSIPSLLTVSQIAAARPGSIWLLGNEPDCVNQDYLDPDVYAHAYHDAYQAIKAADSSAVVVAGQIVQATPLRLRYLAAVLTEYAATYGTLLPADAWAMHGYILNEDPAAPGPWGDWGAGRPPGVPWDPSEPLTIPSSNNILTTDPAIFEGFVVAYREWLADNGYRDLPLLITEFGVLPPKDMIYYEIEGEEGHGQLTEEEGRQRILDFMQATLDYMVTATDASIGNRYDDGRLVQAWAWFSLSHADPLLGGSLHDPVTRERTAYGDLYADYAADIPATVNLRPVALSTQASGDDVDITVTMVNNGTIETPPCTIQCYDGEPQAGGQQIGGDIAVHAVRGAAIPQRVLLTWEDAPSGAHTLYVVVDPDDRVAEEDETDNTLSQEVSVP